MKKLIILKRMLAVTISSVIAFSSTGVIATAQELSEGQNSVDITSTASDFQIENGVLVKYTGHDKNVEIPHGVTTIGTSAFYGCGTIESIKLPIGVVRIDDYAFSHCYNLVRIEIPATVNSIGMDIGIGCYELRYIFAAKGSYAENYANQFGYQFVDIAAPFTDIPTEGWIYDAVKYVYQRGIMTGFTETTFGPAEAMGRDNVVVTLYRMEGEPEVEYKDIYPDVPDGAYFTDAIMWATETGIATGYDDDKNFGVGVLITREQFVTMLYRYANYKGLDTSQRVSVDTYPDGNDVSVFSKEAMEWALGCGIITGEQGLIHPQGQTGRASCATMLMRFMEYYNL